ncbi:MAG: hypothetical protein RRA63_06750 [Candidatus Calescibacterium sp.]|jgi:hypothetical protein|nr:hypothetical protein [Candidatus Calescibacterium sp.]
MKIKRIITILVIFLVFNFHINPKVNGQDNIAEQIKKKKSDIILEMKRNPFEEDEKKKEKKTKEEKEKEKIETKKARERNIKILGKIEWEKRENSGKTIKGKIAIVEIDNKPYILRQGDKIEGITIDKIDENEIEISIEKEKIRKSF